MYEAIILAGGLGTRLRSVVSEVPKVMAPVAGKPFLHYIINKLIDENVTRIILAVGYKSEIIEAFIDEQQYDVEIIFSIEHEPLGTGGGIKLAMDRAISNHVFIINGDSFFDCQLKELMQQHLEQNANISLALKYMQNFDRYGTVNIDASRITKFNEKEYRESGLINAGVYVIQKNVLKDLNLPEKFSLEKDVFEAHTSDLKIMGFLFGAYFIDIGIPEDYEKAQGDFNGS